MVDFQDQARIEREFCAYGFCRASVVQPDLPVCPFNSGSREALARRGWHVHVSPHVLLR
jgi:hypothetical protein